MQLYPGWSARDNYVGGSFFSGTRGYSNVVDVHLDKGDVTCQPESGFSTTQSASCDC